jgi:transposase
LEAIEHSRAVADVARENSVSEQSVSRWVRQYKDEHPEIGDKLTESELDELRRLRRRVKALEQEVEFLGKATAREETAIVDLYAAIPLKKATTRCP